MCCGSNNSCTLSTHSTMPTERSPLLGSSKPRRESTVEYATHLPEDAPVVVREHYNLAGLSPTDFWCLVRGVGRR